MAEGFIQLPVDSNGKALRTQTGGANQPAATHQEVHTVALPDGTLVGPGAGSLPVAQTFTRQKTHVEFIPSSASPTTIYKGYAASGASDAAAVWTIQRFVFTGLTNIDETWTAVGTAVWNSRATETFA